MSSKSKSKASSASSTSSAATTPAESPKSEDDTTTTTTTAPAAVETSPSVEKTATTTATAADADADVIATPAVAPDPAAPKMDYKMMVLPLMMFASRKIDLKDEANVALLQQVFVAIIALVGSVYAYVYFKIQGNKDGSKKIWVPPKAVAALPFGLGPAPELLKPIVGEGGFKETTYKEYEMALFKEACQACAMSAGIAIFSSYKFQVHFSLLVQCVMTPLNSTDNPVMKKYILGSKDGYKEFYSKEAIQVTAPNGTIFKWYEENSKEFKAQDAKFKICEKLNKETAGSEEYKKLQDELVALEKPTTAAAIKPAASVKPATTSDSKSTESKETNAAPAAENMDQIDE